MKKEVYVKLAVILNSLFTKLNTVLWSQEDYLKVKISLNGSMMNVDERRLKNKHRKELS